MKYLWLACSFIATLVAIFCIIFLGTSLADLYAVTLGGISPGERMFMDRAAPNIIQAVAFVVLFGFALFGAISFRRHATLRANGP